MNMHRNNDLICPSDNRFTRLGAVGRVVAIALTTILGLVTPTWTIAAELPSVVVQASGGARQSGFDGVVEAVRQTVVAAQVAGALVQLEVRVGDQVSAGQVLARIDARAANQSAAASDAQVQAARASLEVATRDFERQKQLFEKNYISRANLERAESEFKATQAQVRAQLAMLDAARTQSGLHVVRAPFAGVVSEVPVSLGDMAMPGRPVLTLFDPKSLRVSASVPQSLAARLGAVANTGLKVELPSLGAEGSRVTPLRVQVLPTSDPGTHTVQVRAELPAAMAGVSPGQFARLWLEVPASGARSESGTVFVAISSVVRRAEMTGLYVLDPNGRPVLRQVRLGRVEDDRVEVLSGLSAGERVVTDPQAAARVR